MSERSDGGPAFPTHIYDPNVEPDPRFSVASVRGMSLRDWFAGMAMQRMVSFAGDAMVNADPEGMTGIEVSLARIAYRMADAMLKERER